MNATDKNVVRARREAASNWCLRMAEGSLSLEDEVRLDAWLDAAPENRAMFGRMAAIWLDTPKAADAPELIAVRADALDAMRTAQGGASWRRFANRFGPALAIAACLLILIGAGAIFWSGRPHSYETGIGERRAVVLEDGSRLSLDAATSVEVAYSDHARTLHLLKGRAKFDVAKNRDRPFSVSAGGRVVIATGTAFSVELVQDQMRVVLYEGHVRVLAKASGNGPSRSLTLGNGGNHAVRPVAADNLLKPGALLIASLDRPVATVEPIMIQRSLAWEGGQLSFSDEPLGLAAERINRYSGTPLVVEGDAARLPISGVFNAGDTAGFIDGVSALYPLRAVRRSEVMVLTHENAPS